MKLELDRQEIEKVLLEWAEKQFPGMFNDVSWGGYNRPTAVTFEHRAAEAEKE